MGEIDTLDNPMWPAWATVKIETLSRTDARNALTSAQAFWRDFALAGLTLLELREVIEERRRKGPSGRIAPTSKMPKTSCPAPKPSLAAPDNSLFKDFPPLDPDESRWSRA